MSEPARLSQLIDCVEFDAEEISRYFDRKTGKVVVLERSLLRAIEDGNDEELDEMVERGDEDVEIAREIIDDLPSHERFIDPPGKLDFHEYRQMEKFINSLGDAPAASQLYRAIKGKGAFRYFKDTLSQFGLREQWYKFRDAAIKEYVLEWASAHEITVDESM